MRHIAVIAAFLAYLCDWVCFPERVYTLNQIKSYNVVRLRLLSSRHRRSTSNQPPFGTESDHRELYPEQLQYQLVFNGTNLTIDLEKNRNLIGHNFTEIYYREDGSRVATYPRLKDHCYYHGHIDGMQDSSVSVGLCFGMRGFIRAEDHTYFIEPLNNSTEGDHAFYKKEHIRTKRSSNTIFDKEPRTAALAKHSTWSKSAFLTKRYVKMFLVVDNSEYKNFGSNADIVRARMLDVVNHVDKIYRPHNIRVMLVGLELWTIRDQIRVSSNSDDTLSQFIAWRNNNLLKRVKHDNAQFVTATKFLNDTVGLANKLAMCAAGSGGVNQDHNSSPLGLAATIAHEMGHNLGMSHDKPGCTCGALRPDCVMTDRVDKVFPELFSDCSLEELSVYLENANFGCLLEPPSSDRLYGGPRCGNAFLDPGEECDCGKEEECENPCCNPKTCRLTEGSQCADGECCEDCKLITAGRLCRESGSECDLPEYCTGRSPSCPEDSFKMNGEPCGSGNNYCYNGQCPTLIQHCEKLWGKGATVASNSCFRLNTLGGTESHCGRTKSGYRPCQREDMFCGTLFCTGGNMLPVTGVKAIMLGGLCNKVVERTLEDNLSMVPTGTKCGQNKVCFDYKCQDVKVYGNTVDCSLKCSGQGVCDHRKQCHCNPGWAPPHCDIRYDDLPSGRGLIIGVSTAVAILLLLAVVFGCWMYRKKSKDTGWNWKRESPHCPAQLSPLFENHGAKRSIIKDRPQISQPSFVGSTATRPCTPLPVRPAPTRPPPQPPTKPEAEAHQLPQSVSLHVQAKPPPPTKPLHPANKQVSRPCHPPIPPVKPVVRTGSWKNQQTVRNEVKIALRPPTMPRR